MSQLRPALILLVLLTLITGVVYPLLTTQLAQWWFPAQANGSLLEAGGETRGSALIGQNFTRPEYFQGRPSATGDTPNNPLASSGSNLAASNPALDEAVKQRVAALRAANPQAGGPIPVDLVTASGSGLDPHISPQAALWQVPRVAAARRLAQEQVRQLVEHQTSRPLFGFLGEPTVNVLELNVALDKLPQS
ncbi:potassium-transporting ATPase subunit KdpC [Sodalis sp. RH19]|uniref:potassium-transporting ATPase subunit KdpC n=1 Tax=Sodalis sp. RH19 TaxID=3394334 RepID=UPI0039B39624